MKLKIEKDLLIKMAVVAVLAIAVVAVGSVLVSMLDGGGNEAAVVPVVVEQEKEKEPVEKEEEVPVVYERMLALVTGIGRDEGLMQVYDVDADMTVTLSISDAVKFEDEYGTAMLMDEIVPGHMVNVKYDSASYVPDFVKVAAQVQTIRNLSSLNIDEGLKTIQIGSDIYAYNDYLIARNGDQDLLLSELSVADDVVVRAYQGKIWSIIVENGHGYIVLKNYDAYLEGRLEIGNRTSYTIIGDMRIPVAVGVHKVIVLKEEMTTYTASVSVEENKEYIIDLSDLQPKVAEVVFEVVQEGSTVFINDVKVEKPEEPVKLNYGQYEIRVENEGYMDWEGILIADQSYIVQTIDMESEPLYLNMTGPEGAEFYIDGVFQGVMVAGEPISVPVTPGGHYLTLRKEGYISWSQHIEVVDNGKPYNFSVSELIQIQTETEPVTEPVTEPPTPVDDVYDDDDEEEDEESND